MEKPSRYWMINPKRNRLCGDGAHSRGRGDAMQAPTLFWRIEGHPGMPPMPTLFGRLSTSELPKQLPERLSQIFQRNRLPIILRTPPQQFLRCCRRNVQNSRFVAYKDWLFIPQNVRKQLLKQIRNFADFLIRSEVHKHSSSQRAGFVG